MKDMTRQLTSFYRVIKSLQKGTLIKEVESAEVSENGVLRAVVLFGKGEDIIGTREYIFLPNGNVETRDKIVDSYNLPGVNKEISDGEKNVARRCHECDGFGLGVQSYLMRIDEDIEYYDYFCPVCAAKLNLKGSINE